MIVYCILLIVLLCGCSGNLDNSRNLSTVSIIDRDGFSETISNSDRLKQYQNIDFLSTQPYQKVMRVYGRDLQGNVRAYITSYHPNGQVKQYLEVLNNRACGSFREWFANGQLKIDAVVIGGEGDINTASEKSWLFDGCSQVWDEQGCLIAQIPYVQGELEGESVYFHSNGKLWKCVPFHRNNPDGIMEIYTADGNLFQRTTYINGMQQGPSIRYWSQDQIAYEETYEGGKLVNGCYFSPCGEIVSSIEHGNGFRAIFGKDCINEMHEYSCGILEGEVTELSPDGQVVLRYYVHDGEKHGDEIEYYSENNPKLMITWHQGKIQGIVKTWYPNGVIESQREMSDNAKNGLFTAWYDDSSLMLIEEYNQDQLTRGEYYMRGEKIPITEIIEGNGIATIYDARGNFLKKISYSNGKPFE